MRRPKAACVGFAVYVALGAALTGTAHAQGEAEAPPLPRVSIPEGEVAVSRGKETVATICLNCHTMKYVIDPTTGKPVPARLPESTAKATYGVVPPDLSLMARARKGGATFIYAFLTGFEPEPKDCPQSRNPYAHSGCTAMPNPNVTEAQALDVAAYLETVADPIEETRVRVGITTEIFVAVLTVLAYLVYRRVKKKVKAAAK